MGGCGQRLRTQVVYSSLGRAEHLMLHEPGTIVSLEKRRVATVEGGDARAHTLQPPEPCRGKRKDRQDCARRNKELKKFRRVTNDRRMNYVTHIVDYPGDAGRPDWVLNPYYDFEAPGLTDRPLLATPPYADGVSALEALDARIAGRVGEGDFTHLLLVSMGWNNDQHETLYRINKIIANLTEAMDAQGEPFRPLVLGITWPSVWGRLGRVPLVGHLASYWNKSNDADEIGYAVGAHLVHRTLASAREADPQLKTVVLGHSMGARLLSRALYSGDFVAGVDAPPQVDLFLGLQPAYSANRHISEGGNEGWPYAVCADATATGCSAWPVETVVAHTTSDCDKANPAARIVTRAVHIGGKPGKKRLLKREDAAQVVRWSPEGFSTEPKWGERPVVIDATSIVRGAEEGCALRSDAHNDILDDAMAALIAELLIDTERTARSPE